MVQPLATCLGGTRGPVSSGSATRLHYSWSGGVVGCLTVTLTTPLTPVPALMSGVGSHGVDVEELWRVPCSEHERVHSRLFVSMVEDKEEDEEEVQDVKLRHDGAKSVRVRHHSTLRFSIPTALLSDFTISTAHRNKQGAGAAVDSDDDLGARGGYRGDDGVGLYGPDAGDDATDDADYLGLGEDGDTCYTVGGFDDLGEPDGGGDMVPRLLAPGLRNYGAVRLPHDGASTEETTTADERDLAYMARNGGGRVWGT